MKVIFDLNIIGLKKFGISYAVLEQMKALQETGIDVVNLAIGWNGLAEHKQMMRTHKIPCRAMKYPRKIQVLLNENWLLGQYDYFYQTGFHAIRNIPKSKYVVAIHDTVGLRYPQGEALFPKYTQKLIDKAAKIITVSEFSKNELLSFFKVEPQKIKVIYNGCNQQRFNLKNNLENFQKIKKKFNLPEKYFLTYGGISPRKNIPFLVKAFEKMNKYYLVIGGGYKYAGKSKYILTLDYLEELEIELILKNAFAYICPSYYEGFGLPIIEAMNCGVPVLCSDKSALPEVSGCNALFFNPFKQTELIANVHCLISNNKLRQKLIKTGLQWGKNFSWKNSAKALITVLKNG